MNRHDFTRATREALNAAVTLNIVDAVELGCMIAQHKANAKAIMEELTEAAYTNIHSGNNKHADWCRVLNQWRASVILDSVL